MKTYPSNLYSNPQGRLAFIFPSLKIAARIMHLAKILCDKVRLIEVCTLDQHHCSRESTLTEYWKYLKSYQTIAALPKSQVL